MGLFTSLFGKKVPGGSSNRAFDQIQGAYSPATGYTAQAGDAISRFLGGDTSGFDAYKGATGYEAGLGRLLSGVTGNRAARGLLRSGSTGDAYVQRAGEYDAASAGNYLQQLAGLGQLGLGAGQLITGAGQQSTDSTTKGGGLGKALGLGLSIFSDPKLKTDVKRKGNLGVYEYRYKDDPPGTRRRGTMADEVEREFPEAAGPRVGGFRTVDYLKLLGAL